MMCNCCEVDPLAVACEGLVTRALEVLGKRVIRRDRGRWHDLGDLPWHAVHTRWTVQPKELDAALNGAWDRVPELCGHWGGNAAGIAEDLDSYVRHVVAGRRQHSLNDVVAIVRYHRARELSDAAT